MGGEAGASSTPAQFVWYPDESFRHQTNWSAFLAAENLADDPALERKAASDPQWFWDALRRFLGVAFITS
jgi:acetyl-CoA synthetase